MSAAFERLKKLNESQKNRYKEMYDKEKRQKLKEILKEHSIWHIEKKGSEYFVIRDVDGRGQQLNHIGQLYKLLSEEGVHITNISMLSKATKIIGYYMLTYENWHDMTNFKSFKIYENLNIIKVEDMERYVLKSVLVGKMKVHVKTPYYTILLSNNEKDIIMVSDLILKTTNSINVAGFYARNIKITNLDVSEQISLSGYFNGCKLTESIILKNFDTRNVEDFSYMFLDCKELQNITINEIRTDNAKSLEYMFSGCANLERLDLNHFNVDKVSIFESMFEECESLEEVKLDKWKINVELAKYFDNMFFECSSLNKINIDIFKYILKHNRSAITMFNGTKFEGCKI